MKDLNSELDKLKYDTRMIDWNLSKGLLSREELKSHMDGLQDVQGESEPIDLEGAGLTEESVEEADSEVTEATEEETTPLGFSSQY